MQSKFSRRSLGQHCSYLFCNFKGIDIETQWIIKNIRLAVWQVHKVCESIYFQQHSVFAWALFDLLLQGRQMCIITFFTCNNSFWICPTNLWPCFPSYKRRKCNYNLPYLWILRKSFKRPIWKNKFINFMEDAVAVE